MSQALKTAIERETGLEKKIEIYLESWNQEEIKKIIDDLGYNEKKPNESLKLFNKKIRNINDKINNFQSTERLNTIYNEK